VASAVHIHPRPTGTPPPDSGPVVIDGLGASIPDEGLVSERREDAAFGRGNVDTIVRIVVPCLRPPAATALILESIVGGRDEPFNAAFFHV